MSKLDNRESLPIRFMRKNKLNERVVCEEVSTQ